MAIADIKPHPEYAMLVKQFYALKNLLICKEQGEMARGKDWKIDDVARKTLDSERAANALLTEENEQLRAENAQLRGTMSYIAAQARAGYPTVLSVIRANAEAALNRAFQEAVASLPKGGE